MRDPIERNERQGVGLLTAEQRSIHAMEPQSPADTLRFKFEALLAGVEHRFREVYAVDMPSRTCEWNRYTTRSHPQLQDVPGGRRLGEREIVFDVVLPFAEDAIVPTWFVV